ncbi:hypothetical protein BG910_04580 [Neisseria chenwenguii]|uniref:Uncharacterized protein n=1 Tax=Neisseria chenwenguii TaxID=1853278 RepID=A0A220S0V6_9NEIS|nr:hypothetical protein BG910_04580 [Neisseria chenwenguii]ROV54862.1 hypothetical protein EGS38_10260 [Neisseria chenwenguii]
MMEMFNAVLEVRLSVLQIMLISSVLLATYVFYRLVMCRIAKKPVWSFIAQLGATVVISFLLFQIRNIHK